MAMRDLQRLERLSSTAALGLWADDVVLALDRAASDSDARDADRELLDEAAGVLDAACDRIAQPLARPPAGHSLAATETTLTAIGAFAQSEAQTDLPELLRQIALTLREVAGGTTQDPTRIELAMKLFGMVGETQLVESNAVLTSRKNPAGWTATQTISSFS
jgi:hypothetical protein